MSFITKKHLPRRTFLRSVVGASVALPLLDSMIPSMTALAATAANPKSRLGFVYVPHGAVMDKWTPATEGAGYEMTQILSPLEAYRDRLTIISGLADIAAESQGGWRRGSLALRSVISERRASEAHRKEGRGIFRAEA